MKKLDNINQQDQMNLYKTILEKHMKDLDIQNFEIQHFSKNEKQPLKNVIADLIDLKDQDRYVLEGYEFVLKQLLNIINYFKNHAKPDFIDFNKIILKTLNEKDNVIDDLKGRIVSLESKISANEHNYKEAEMIMKHVNFDEFMKRFSFIPDRMSKLLKSEEETLLEIRKEVNKEITLMLDMYDVNKYTKTITSDEVKEVQQKDEEQIEPVKVEDLKPIDGPTPIKAVMTDNAKV